MKILNIIWLILLASLPDKSFGRDYLSGSELLDSCISPKGSSERAFCIGFIRGTAEGGSATAITVNIILNNESMSPFVLCIKSEEDDKLIDVVVSHFKNNYQDLGFRASSEVILALSDAYVCKPK